MDARDQFRQIINERQGRLAAGDFPEREAALLALVRAGDSLEPDANVGTGSHGALVAALRRPDLGMSTALAHCLAASGTGGPNDPGGTDAWARELLDACRDLDAARLVLWLADAGEMRLAAEQDGDFVAWPRGTAVPLPIRERDDLHWLARRSAQHAGDGAVGLTRLAYQLPYPDDAAICGVSVAACRAVLASVEHAASRVRGQTGSAWVASEAALCEEIAASSGLDVREVRQVVSGLTLDLANAAWHAAVPGGPQPPLVRVGAGRLAVSRGGLRTEPLFFLLREMRRRDPEGYHNAAHQREVALRDDLYRLFDDRRYVTSPRRILLRRDDRRNRTDIDAAIFDRKTGTLAVFELKSSDPYVGSVDELERRRASLRRAGQQMAQILDWLNRNGADEVLSRMDRAAAKRFRVHRVLPFVIGRYSADRGSGPAGHRVAWGTWPRVLRQLENSLGGNPLLALHSALMVDDAAQWSVPSGSAPFVVGAGAIRVTVFADWAAVQAGRQM